MAEKRKEGNDHIGSTSTHVLKYSIPTYLVLAALLLRDIRGGSSWDAVLILLGLTAAIAVLGLLLGKLVCVLVRKPRYERFFYGAGQVVAFFLIVVPCLNVLFSC